MFIKDIPYFHLNDTVTCSMSACLAMLLSYNGQTAEPEDINEQFSAYFMSQSFRRWYSCDISEERKELGEMVACSQYLIENSFRNVKGGVFRTEVPKLRLAFIKRDIPVIITCKFPVPGGAISTSVLVKGWVDDYLVVNDPRGNAMSLYIIQVFICVCNIHKHLL